MNRRLLFLAFLVPVAGFLAVHNCFSQSGALSKRRIINLPDRSPQAAFSNAILVGDTLYISGNIGLDPKTGKPPEKIEDEIRNLLESYKTLLTQAGLTMDDLVYVQIASTDLAYYDTFNAIYKRCDSAIPSAWPSGAKGSGGVLRFAGLIRWSSQMGGMASGRHQLIGRSVRSPDNTL